MQVSTCTSETSDDLLTIPLRVPALFVAARGEYASARRCWGRQRPAKCRQTGQVFNGIEGDRLQAKVALEYSYVRCYRDCKTSLAFISTILAYSCRRAFLSTIASWRKSWRFFATAACLFITLIVFLYFFTFVRSDSMNLFNWVSFADNLSSGIEFSNVRCETIFAYIIVVPAGICHWYK